MSQLNFPTNPSPGQLHTIGENTWVWNGAAWIKQIPIKNIVDVFTVTNTLYVTSTTNSTSTITGALIVTGGVGIGQDVTVGGQLSAERVRITDAIMDSSLVTVNTTGTIIVDSYSLGDYRAAEYLVQIDSGVGPTATFQISKILMVVSNTSTVQATEYGVIHTDGPLVTMGTWGANVTGGTTVNLYFSPIESTNKIIAVFRTAISA
jgi:hypothetical protein